MAEIMTSVKVVNSAIRTLIAAGLLGAVGYGGYFGYENYIKPGMNAKQAVEDLEALEKEFAIQQQALAEKTEQLEVVQVENEKLQTSLKLLKVDRRMANVEVLELGTDENGRPEMLVRFTEIDQNGNPVGASRDFSLSGDRLYIDCWVVNFEDKYVEEADALRSASLCVFKSIYGDIDGPRNAHSLDQESVSSGAPGVYRDDQQSAFEQKIWDDFWNVCNDNDKQRELGIRASYGQANYMRVEEGKVYQVQLRSSGSTTIHSLDIADEP